MLARIGHGGMMLQPTAGGGGGGLSARYWRVYITANDGSGSYIGMTELELKDTLGGTDLTSAALASANAAASSSVNASNTEAMAFDNSSGNGWLGWVAPQWIRWDFGAGNDKTIRQITIRGSWNAPSASPKDFELQRSGNGTDWTTVLTVTGQTAWTGSTDVRTFNVP